MASFHETTSTILKYVLAEQRRDLMLTEQRLEQADESTLRTDVERERFARTTAKFRDQIAELTTVVGDFERLVQHVKDENAEAAELEQARAEVAAIAASAEADPVTEAFVDVADAERYAQRDEYVNSDDAEAEQQEQQLAQERWFATEVLGLDGDRDFGEQLRERGAEAESEAAQEAWIAQGECAVDEALDARDAEAQVLSYGFVGAWDDPAVRRAVRETIAESGS